MVNPTEMTSKEKKYYAQKVTILGSIADAILGFLKIFIGSIFHSHALIVDGIHSFTDVLSDIFVVFITRVSHEGPDHKHPYGHEKFETIGSAALGSLLIATGGALIYETIRELIGGEVQPTPGWPTYFAAGLSLVVKEGLYHYTHRAGVKLNSKLIMANAWHSRSDAFSSLVVLIGLLFSGFGYTWVDSLAALVVSFIIAKIGWRFVKESLVELAETSVEKELEGQIQACILEVEGVDSSHALRTRRMGHKVLVDVNIEVNSHLTASEGHEITSWVIKNLKDNVKEVEDVTVHLDVEDDRAENESDPYAHTYEEVLPLRKEVLKELGNVWDFCPLLNDARHIRLHYIKRKIIPEIILPYHLASEPAYKDIKAFQRSLDQKAENISWYGKTTLLFGELGY